MNIEHTASSNVAIFNVQRHKVALDTDPIEIDADERVTDLPAEWGLTVSFARTREGYLDLLLSDGLLISIPVAPTNISTTLS